MKITKKGNVIVETTHRNGGCLEQGGLCGRLEAYAVADVAKVLGVTPSQIADLDQDVALDERGTPAQIIRATLRPVRIVRRGIRIA